MVGKRAPSTRSINARKFAGPPAELDKTEPPIYRQIIQYIYFLLNTHPESNEFDISRRIAKAVINIWKLVNPRLPLIKENSINVKLMRIVKVSKELNRVHCTSYKKKMAGRKVRQIIRYCCL